MSLCKLSDCAGDKAATFVAKVDKPLMSFALEQLEAGAGAVALVSLSRLEHYVVVSGQPHKIYNYSQKLKEMIKWCTEAPWVDGAVEWVMPVNRRLQRRFFWGDVASGLSENLAGCFLAPAPRASYALLRRGSKKAVRCRETRMVAPRA